MSNYKFSTWLEFDRINKQVDMWCPFQIHEHNGLSVPNIRTTPMCDNGVSYDGQHIELESHDWEPVRIGAHGDICEPAEFVSERTLQGLEPGLYQCIIVEDGNIDLENDDLVDPTTGWALMKHVA